MTGTAALAARLRAMDDDALVAALVRRGVATAGIRDFFDLAEALLAPESLQACLVRLDRFALAALVGAGDGATSVARLAGLLLVDAGAVDVDRGGGADRSRAHDAAASPDLPPGPGIVAWPEVAARLEGWPAISLPVPGAAAPPPVLGGLDDARRAAIDSLAAERAFAAASAVAELLFALRREPARLLADGTIGRPETRRLADVMGMAEPSVAILVAAAERAGLVERTGAQLVASERHDRWIAAPIAERWSDLVAAWASGLPELVRVEVGGRSAGAAAAPGAATASGEPAGLTIEDVRRVLHWLYPAGRDWLDPELDARLAEAELLGLTTGQGLGAAAVAVLAGDRMRAAEVLARALPAPVERLYLQQDLTALATGPLTSGLDARLRTMADPIGRAIAASYRFTPESVGRAVAAGDTADAILAFLDELSLSGVPQPLEYLVRETAARHGALRVGSVDARPRPPLPPGATRAASDAGFIDAAPSAVTTGGGQVASPASSGLAAVSYLRSDDLGLLEAALIDRSLVALSLRREGDRLLSPREPGQVLWALLDARYPAAAEDVRGRIVELRRPVLRRPAAPEAAHPYQALVERLRLADAGTPEDAGLAWLSRQLEAAIRNRAVVTVSVRMPDGAVVDHRLEPTGLAGGRLRARDSASDVERTLPLTHITAVLPG
jgi:hypothetical protein